MTGAPEPRRTIPIIPARIFAMPSARSRHPPPPAAGTSRATAAITPGHDTATPTAENLQSPLTNSSYAGCHLVCHWLRRYVGGDLEPPSPAPGQEPTATGSRRYRGSPAHRPDDGANTTPEGSRQADPTGTNRPSDCHRLSHNVAGDDDKVAEPYSSDEGIPATITDITTPEIRRRRVLGDLISKPAA